MVACQTTIINALPHPPMKSICYFSFLLFFCVHHALSSTCLNGMGHETKHRNTTGPGGIAAECRALFLVMTLIQRIFRHCWTAEVHRGALKKNKKRKEKKKRGKMKRQMEKKELDLPVRIFQSQYKYCAKMKGWRSDNESMHQSVYAVFARKKQKATATVSSQAPPCGLSWQMGICHLQSVSLV